MTKDEQIEQIEWNLGQIARVTERKWGSGTQAQAKFIRKHLERIEHLLQEPEPRLINICNQLGRENAILRNDLTEMTLNYNQSEKRLYAMQQRVKSLRATCSKLMTDAEITNLRVTNVRLLRRNKDQYLRRAKKWLEEARLFLEDQPK